MRDMLPGHAGMTSVTLKNPNQRDQRGRIPGALPLSGWICVSDAGMRQRCHATERLDKPSDKVNDFVHSSQASKYPSASTVWIFPKRLDGYSPARAA